MYSIDIYEDTSKKYPYKYIIDLMSKELVAFILISIFIYIGDYYFLYNINSCKIYEYNQ